MSKILLTLACVGQFGGQNSSNGQILSSILLGKFLIEFWCTMPIKGINLMFELEAQKIIVQKRNESIISFLMNENRIVVIVMSILLFLLVLMNVNMLQDETIQIYSSKEVGAKTMRFVAIGFLGLLFGSLADIQKRLLKN